MVVVPRTLGLSHRFLRWSPLSGSLQSLSRRACRPAAREPLTRARHTNPVLESSGGTSAWTPRAGATQSWQLSCDFSTVPPLNARELLSAPITPGCPPPCPRRSLCPDTTCSPESPWLTGCEAGTPWWWGQCPGKEPSSGQEPRSPAWCLEYAGYGMLSWDPDLLSPRIPPKGKRCHSSTCENRDIPFRRVPPYYPGGGGVGIGQKAL